MKFLAGWIFILAAVAATAGELSPRFYVAGDLGVAWRELNGPLLKQSSVDPARASFRRHSDEAEGYFHGRVGVKLTDFFSFEAGYQEFGYTYVSILPPPNIIFLIPPPTEFRFRDYAFTFDPVFSWHVSDRVRLYGFWGLAINRAETRLDQHYTSIYSGVFQPYVPRSSWSYLSRFGAGVDIRLVKTLELNTGVAY